MIYPIPLISVLLQDMDQAMWYFFFLIWRVDFEYYDDESSKRYIDIYYTLKAIRMIKDYIWYEECSAD